MPTRAKAVRATLEPLEARGLLSTLPVNTLAVASGNVATPGASAQVSTPVTAHNLNGKPSVIIGESITPAPGSALAPQFVAAYGPNGQRLPIQQGAPFVPGVRDSVTAFITVSAPGPVTTVVTGAHGSTGAFQVRAYLPGDVNGDGQVTIADLAPFAKAYLATTADRNYNPAADANLNGVIGIPDGRYLERNMAPITHRVPIFVTFTLPANEAARPPHSTNSGGVTALQHVTIVGHTVPGALVIADSGLGDYTFSKADSGRVLPTDASGRFVDRVTLSAGINNFDFLIFDPYGQQHLQDYPVFWTTFAQPNSPINTH